MNLFYVRDRHRKPHAFAVKDSSLFGVAGIWENWRDPATDKWERTFATLHVIVIKRARFIPAHRGLFYCIAK
jgi:putative SOS response-associated peptidase YedK